MPDSASVPGSAASAGLSLFGAQPGGEDGSVCSRKGCRNDAAALLIWNNPRIHTPDRRKTWASCADHVAFFEEYLGERGLLRETRPLTGPSRTPTSDGG